MSDLNSTGFSNTDDDETQPLIQNVSQDANREFSCFDPKKKFYRYFSLIFICLLTFGPYFCYVLPGALQTEFQRDLKISTAQFTLFVSLYSWPNVVLAFFGGLLIDSFLGVPFGAFLFSCTVSIGQLLFGFGAYVNKVWLMDVGRFVFGMGAETVLVAQKAYCVNWFPRDEVNVVFGFIASSALLGSSLNQIVMNPIYNYISSLKSGYECLGAAILLASSTVILSTICAFIMIFLDKRRTRSIRMESGNQLKATQKIKFTDALKFPFEFWLLVIIVAVFYCATFPFVNFAKVFFIRKYNDSPTVAALQQSLFFLATVITSPLFGTIVDSTGYNLLWVILSLLMAILSHALFMFTFINSFVPVIILGLSLSLLCASLWPMVSLIVKKEQLATAYGLMQSFQNLALATLSILAGILLQNNGYFVLELFFLVLCLIGLFSSILLYFVDRAKNGSLCLSKKALDQFQSNQLAVN